MPHSRPAVIELPVEHYEPHPLPRQHMPLGHTAVRAAEEQLLYADQAHEAAAFKRTAGQVVERMNHDPTVYQRAHRNAYVSMRSDIWRVRESFRELKALGPDVEEYFDIVMDQATDLPPLIGDWRKASGRISGKPQRQGGSLYQSWAEWIAEGTTDKQLLNVVQWHDHRIRKYNEDPAIQSQVKERRDSFSKGLKRLFDHGYIHPETYDTAAERVQTAKIYAADPVELVKIGARGINHVGPQHIYIVPELLTSTKTKTFEHELSHSVIQDKEWWVNEVGADLMAGLISTDSFDAKTAFAEIAKDEDASYTDGNEYLLRFLRDKPGATAAFLRYATAPVFRKNQARHELNLNVGLSPTGDVIKLLTPHILRAIEDVSLERNLAADGITPRHSS